MPAQRSIGKVVKNGNSLMVSLPKPMLHALGWALGTRVVLEQRENCVVIAGLERAFQDSLLSRVDTNAVTRGAVHS